MFPPLAFAKNCSIYHKRLGNDLQALTLPQAPVSIIKDKQSSFQARPCSKAVFFLSYPLLPFGSSPYSSSYCYWIKSSLVTQ